MSSRINRRAIAPFKVSSYTSEPTADGPYLLPCETCREETPHTPEGECARCKLLSRVGTMTREARTRYVCRRPSVDVSVTALPEPPDMSRALAIARTVYRRSRLRRALTWLVVGQALAAVIAVIGLIAFGIEAWRSIEPGWSFWVFGVGAAAAGGCSWARSWVRMRLAETLREVA